MQMYMILPATILFFLIRSTFISSMALRKILVTGANKGIGFALVRRLLTDFEDTFVYLGSRDSSRGEAAVQALISESPSWSTRLKLVHLEVDSVASVQAAKELVALSLESDRVPLYAVVNNAGIGFGNSMTTTFATNVYGCRNVCDAFIPLLNPEKGRIVFISSASGPMFVAKCSEQFKTFFKRKDITWPEIDEFISSLNPSSTAEELAAKGLDSNIYGFSKALLNLYMVSLSNQYPNLIINSCTPGYIETDLTKGFDGNKKAPYEGTHAPFALLFRNPLDSGKFYGSDCLRSPIDRYRNPGDPEYDGE